MAWSNHSAVPGNQPRIAAAQPRPAVGRERVGHETGEFTIDLALAAQSRLAQHDEPTTSWEPVEFWRRLVDGELRLGAHFAADERVYLVAEGREPDRVEAARITERERDVFCRLLAGQSQKAMSYDLDLCPSTVATHAARAFAKLNLSSAASAAPLALVLIGQAAYGAIELVDARVTASVREGRLHVVANVTRPPESRLDKLTTAEREVALALVEGYSKFDIAHARSTSVHTIGRQISSLFGKLNVKGRFDLICRMCR